jgi:hypothetical protein
MTAAQKWWTFRGIYSANIEETPEHICLQEGDALCQTAQMSFDIDSITGFCSGLGIAKGGIRWNVMQMPVYDLQSGLYLTRRRVQFLDSHGHFHSIRKPSDGAPILPAGRLISFECVSLYFLLSQKV